MSYKAPTPGRFDARQNTTDYQHPQETNLLSVERALQYRWGTGEPELRVNLGANAFVISGNVNIPGYITVVSSPESPNHVHLTEVGSSGILTTPWLPVAGNVRLDAGTNLIGNVRITDGHVTVDNFPAFPSNISITQMPAVTGNVHVYGNVTIDSLPEVEIKNDSGNPIPVEWVYGDGASLIPWEVQVARGKIPGVTGLSISGYQESVPNTWVPVWGLPTAYTYFGTAQQVRVWSSSASDTNVRVTVTGLDSNYAVISETVTLSNGTTGVLTSQSFFRVNNLNIAVDAMNVGIIYAGNTSKTDTLATIDAGAGRSQMSIYTVPAGYTFYLTQVNMYTNQVGSQTGLYRSYTVTNAGVVNIVLTFPFVDNYTSRKVVPRPYAEKTDIQWQAQSSQGTSRMGIQIEGYLIQNGL